jgi:Asp-tRNA(Asn)/Glu-tRNA(Gln) amidotransferase A subunit family amidase
VRERPAGVAVQAELVRRGEVSSRELVELALGRIDTLDPELRAFVAVYADQARAEVDRADARRARGEERALLGVPIAVKGEFDLEGEVTGRGTSAFNAPAAADAEVIRRLRDTGFLARDVPTTLGLLFRGVREFVGEVERPQRLERRTRALARPGALVVGGLLDRLLRAEQAMVARVLDRFEQFDVLLTPVMSEPAVPAQLMEGRGATATFLWESSWVPFTVLWNQTGQPAASLPAGFAPDGLPLAVQLVGRPNGERTLLALSAQLEDARPWSTRRPPTADTSRR